MGAPQIIIIATMALNLLVCIKKHGSPKGNYHIGTHIIDLIILIIVLFWGGFFN